MALPARPEAPFSLAASPFTKRLERGILRFIQQQNLLRSGERVLVAVSGGPDSTALLVALSRLRSRLEVDITAAHFDHGLRTRAEAGGDLSFVSSLAEVLGVRLVNARSDVTTRRAHESPEEAARRRRYAFLLQQAKLTDAPTVAVGHTLDDQAETVLLHLLRGSGLDGLSGMLTRSPWPFGAGPALARPLLAVRRQDTERYCLDFGIKPRRDPTNDLLVATRNRVRRQLLPLLREFNPVVEEALVRLADAAAEDSDYLEATAAGAWTRLANRSRGRVSFQRADLADLHPSILTRLLRRSFAHLTDRSADLEAIHIQALRESLRKRRGRQSLPHGLIAVVNACSLSFTRGSLRTLPPVPDATLAVPGSTRVGRWRVQANLVPVTGRLSKGDGLEAYFDADAVGASLAVRARRPGDRLRPLGLGGEKKVQDILVDAKVPAADRDAVPLVCAPSGVVWVVGHRIDERYALRPDSVRALHLRFELHES